MTELAQAAYTLHCPAGALRSRTHSAVFFDAGNTLFQAHPSVGELYAQVAEPYGLKVDAHEVERLFREEWKLRASGPGPIFTSEAYERVWWHSLVQAVFERLGSLGEHFEEYFDYLYDLFATERVWRLYPEVETVLDELNRRGTILGIVSNWDSRLFSICDGFKLTSRFKFILPSAAAGVSKPHPGIFEQALARAGVSAELALHVGDSLEDDIRGARAAGLDALLIERCGRSVDETVAWADSLAAVLELV